MTFESIALIAVAGFIGGAVNAAAGGGTLVTFPALVAAGIPPISANVTSSVGLLAGYAGGSVAYRRELGEQRERVARFAAVAIIGGIAGAVILLLAPSSFFEAIVPYLVIGSALLLAVQPALSAWLRGRSPDIGSASPGRSSGWPAQVGVLLASIYGSYFGAGLGVILLAVLGLLVADSLQRLNALKGLLSLAVNAVGVAIFVFSGLVHWIAVAVLIPAAFAGGTVGAGLARRIPPLVLRYTVVALGLVVGALMLVRV